MTAKSNLRKAEKLMEERKKELAQRSLDKDPKKAGLEKVLRDIADVAKKEGLSETT